MKNFNILCLIVVVFFAIPCECQDVPDEVVIDTIADWFEGAPFAHSMHVDFADSCESCHHFSDGEMISCATCHEATLGAMSPDLPSLKKAYHDRCMGCHSEVEAATGCTDCHARARLPEGPELVKGVQ